MPSTGTMGRDLLNVPMGDMITQMALAIAEAQLALDESGARQAELMSGKMLRRDPAGNLIDKEGELTDEAEYVDTLVRFGADSVSMMELGFTPAFYQFIETVIEVKITIKITDESASARAEKGARRTTQVSASRSGVVYGTSVTPVDATYSSKYTYSAEGASLLRTKLAPVPPPAALEARVRALAAQYETDRKADADAQSQTNLPKP